MGKTPFHVTDAEWAVLQRLWDAGPATVRQLADRLYPIGGPSEYARYEAGSPAHPAETWIRRFTHQPSLPGH